MSSSKKPKVVTIRGTLTPCVELPRGETCTLTLTDRIQVLIDSGFVEVVDNG